jgi:integrative and conjugative element protein (TIGR02256 family)
MTATDPDLKVEVSEEVLAELNDAARTALPYETGGLLIGWRDGDRVIVRGSLKLGTPNPRTNRFEIHTKKATKVLKDYLRTTSDPLEGYVGAWHTHPALASPSGTDFETFEASAAATQAPLAFIVLATNGDSSIAHITWAGRDGTQVITRAQSPITVERIRSE